MSMYASQGWRKSEAAESAEQSAGKESEFQNFFLCLDRVDLKLQL